MIVGLQFMIAVFPDHTHLLFNMKFYCCVFSLVFVKSDENLIKQTIFLIIIHVQVIITYWHCHDFK